jgi:hypothetical protein
MITWTDSAIADLTAIKDFCSCHNTSSKESYLFFLINPASKAL